MRGTPTGTEQADELREQAASCRRLALGATTASGSMALRTAAHQFEDDASRADAVTADALSDGDTAALVRAREALERQSAQWLRPRFLPSAE